MDLAVFDRGQSEFVVLALLLRGSGRCGPIFGEWDSLL